MVSKTRSDMVRRQNKTINHSHDKTHSEFPEGETTPTCTSCPVAKYSDVSSNGPCTSCGSGTTTSTGSTSASQCICNVGYYLDGSSCLSCPANTSPPSTSGLTSVSQCICDEGYYLDGSSCTSCKSGTMTASTGSTSASQCICDKGYYLDGSSCTSCGSGFTTTSIGSTLSSQCFEMCPSPPECVCDVGTYLNGTSCEICPSRTRTHRTGSLYIDDCITVGCEEGMFLSEGKCKSCSNMGSYLFIAFSLFSFLAGALYVRKMSANRQQLLLMKVISTFFQCCQLTTLIDIKVG